MTVAIGSTVVVRAKQHGRTFSRIARVESASPLVVALRQGGFGGGIRWARHRRELAPSDLLREATAREVATGYLLSGADSQQSVTG